VHEKPVRVVHLRPERVRLLAVVLADEVHGGERREADAERLRRGNRVTEMSTEVSTLGKISKR
jgi:hypothetical protein